MQCLQALFRESGGVGAIPATGCIACCRQATNRLRIIPSPHGPSATPQALITASDQEPRDRGGHVGPLGLQRPDG